MAKRIKKFLKKAGKAAALAAAAYGASRLGKKRLGADKLTEGNIGIGQSAPIIDDYNYKPKFRHKPYHPSDDIDVAYSAKGGRIGAKKGGHVKSMGIAKRGGGVAKR